MPRKPITPAIPNRPGRTEILSQAVRVIRLLLAGPAQTATIVERLGIPQRTTERILSSLRAADLGLTTEVRGRERWHSLPADTLRKAAP